MRACAAACVIDTMNVSGDLHVGAGPNAQCHFDAAELMEHERGHPWVSFQCRWAGFPFNAAVQQRVGAGVFGVNTWGRHGSINCTGWGQIARLDRGPSSPIFGLTLCGFR